MDGIAAYSCNCTNDFMGERCELPIGQCSFLPCANGGTCIPMDSSAYTCTCPSGFTGPNCTTLLPCDSLPCANGGTCISVDNSIHMYTCTCPTGFTGPNCSVIQATSGDINCHNETIVVHIQDQAALVTVAVSLVVVLVLCSVTFTIIGYFCGYNCRSTRIDLRNGNEMTQRSQPVLRAQSAVREEDIRLERNNAYDRPEHDYEPIIN